MNIIRAMITPALLLTVCSTALADKSKTEVIEKSYAYRPGQTVVVDNVYGSITVKGHDREVVKLKVHRRSTARNDEMMRQSEKHVMLDITNDADLIEFYVDGPFRRQEDRTHRKSRYNERDYKIIFDFELCVPRKATLQIKTVMEGDIAIHGIMGDYEVGHVNGSIDMTGLKGSGEAYSVNGDVHLDFDANPRADCRFGALNGEVRMFFRKGLNADFTLKTFNGEFYTDFALKTGPNKTFNEIKRNGKTVYKAGHLTRVRAGQGGPLIQLDGFNGNMFILNKDDK